MAAPKGNRFWEARSTHGRNPKFENSDQLMAACIEYFEWAHENPLMEDKIFQFQGSIVRDSIYKMRAMTVDGLSTFLDISIVTWRSYKDRGEDFLSVITRAEQIIRDQKFSGAAADLLNANIIARDLGLSDKSSSEVRINTDSLSEYMASRGK